MVPADRLVSVPALAATLRERGFGSAGVIYDEDARAELEELYAAGMARYAVSLEEKWLPTLALADPAARAWFSDGIRSIASRAFAAVLDPHEAMVWAGEFAIKPPGLESRLGYHQDASVTDESRYRCLNSWASLSPSSEANGALRFVPGSHTLPNAPRLTVASTSFNVVDGELEAREVLVEAAVGEALVFDGRIVHRSLPNLTDEARVAVRALIRPREAPLRFYFVDTSTPPGTAEAFEVSERYWLEEGAYSRPREGTAEPKGTVPWQQLEGEALQRAVAALPRPEFSEGRATRGAAPSDPGRASRLFASELAQDRFDRHGFVVMPFLQPDELRWLRTFLDEVKPALGNTFQSSQDVEEGTFRQTVSDGVISLMRRAVDQHFIDPRILLGAFLLKPPGPKTDKSPHQDWALVDERFSYSVAVWCPLVDTNERNGMLHLMAGTHRVWPTFRGRNLPQPMEHLDVEALARRLVPVPCRAGDAIVFDNRLVHWSPANQTDEPRPVAAVGLCPQDAVTVHFEQGSDGRLYRAEVDDSFYRNGGIYAAEQRGVRSKVAVDALCPDLAIHQLPQRAPSWVAEPISS